MLMYSAILLCLAIFYKNKISIITREEAGWTGWEIACSQKAPKWDVLDPGDASGKGGANDPPQGYQHLILKGMTTRRSERSDSKTILREKVRL